MAFQKILCPIDFSAGSDYAQRVAVRLAIRWNAELVLAHAWYAGEYRFPSRAIDQIVEDEERGLAAAVEDARRLGAERVTSRLLAGYPWQEIVEVLRAEPAFDLVVMGTVGRTGFSRVLLGSVAERVLRHAPCPVLVTRKRAEVLAFRNVLCPVDLSEDSHHAIDLAAKLVEPGGSGITLLHAIERPVTYSGDWPMKDYAEDLDRQADRRLEQWATALRAKVSVPVVWRSQVGDPGVLTLTALADEPAFELVVTGSRGKTGLRRALLGSVAEKIVRHAPCPVLVARRREEA
jgi:nucleotide-binding universal stress UspA family protein